MRRDHPLLEPGRIAKLPVWAQDLLQDKNRRIRHLESRIDELLKPNQGSRVVADPCSDHPQHLPDYTTVEYTLSDQPGAHLSNVISVSSQTDGKGKKFLNINGGSTLRIEPWATNAFHVYLVER